MTKSKGSGGIRVVGLGQACVDYLGRLPFYPKEDGKVELLDLHTRCGGPASTALVTLSRLGVPTAFIGSLSDDPFGRKIVENLRLERVDISSVKVSPGYATQFAFIGISGDGKRTIFWTRGTVPALEPEDVDLARFPKAKVLHVDGLMIPAAVEAAGQAKGLGMIVVMDAGTMREGSRELASMVDILIASEGFAAPLVGEGATPEQALFALRELGPKQVIVTLGERGSVGLAGDDIYRQGAFPVEVVDTTGAGDVYHGAYIYGFLQGWNMPLCMRFASAAAALKCTGIGAQTAIADIEAVERLLAAAPEI
jgi:ribokinase